MYAIICMPYTKIVFFPSKVNRHYTFIDGHASLENLYSYYN